MLTPEIFDKLINNKVVDDYEKKNQELTQQVIALLVAEELNKITIRNNANKLYKRALHSVRSSKLKRTKEIKKIFNELVTNETSNYKRLSRELNESINQIVTATIKNTNGDLNNLTKTIAYQTKKTYVDAMNELYKQVITGKKDYNSSIKQKIEELSRKGITFKTSNGRNERIETVVKRSLHGSIKSVADIIGKKIGEDIDYNCVKIGHSPKCRPTHQPIDDVIMSKEMFKEYEPLTEEYNCNHIVNYLWLEEFENTKNKVVYGNEHKSLKEIENNYKKQQKINYLKRQVKTKKNVIASGNKSDKAKKELQNARSKLRVLNSQQSENLIKLTKGSEFIYKGNKYIVDEKNVKNEFNRKEMDFANWLSKYQFKEVVLMPKINKPDGIKVPDLKIDNEYYDMKIITGTSNQVIYHNVYGKQEQANNFLFETSNSSLSMEELKEQVNRVFKRTDVPHVKKIGIKKASDFIIIKKE